MKRLLLSLLIAPPLLAQQQQARSAGSISIPFEKYTLNNGLTVVLSEDHTTPTVAVEVIYHVGSKNEVVGHTGFAHMFEHVMFTGSGHVPYGLHDKFTEGVGGSNNGQTYFDWTRYWETDPSNYLETALWLEADRMGFLLDSLDDKKFRAQRDIVKNERRQSYDNQPYGRDRELIGLAMYPNGHPYSWPTIGAMSDLSAATVEDVKRFFRLYYAPNNATLVIVGDINREQTKTWVAKYFGDLARGKAISRPGAGVPSLRAEKRLTFEDRVQVPRLWIQWPSVTMYNADAPALDLLGEILAGSRTARLTKALVYDKPIAANVSAGQTSSENVGDFSIIVTPRPEHSLTEIETQVDSIIARLKRDGPTAEELKRVKAGQELDFLNGLQSNLGKAFQLADDQTFRDDPSYTFRVGYAKTQAVTAADIKRVANKYLGPGRIVLSNVPVGKRQLASHADRSTIVTDPLTEKTTEIRP
ncbi:MAG TPA: pitrilysin family protein [Gemmatimonadaceae bacterium]|jgi:zinc protease|nr:pitrilysin family protein [Gemmatimonadaceae bacterium]